MAEIRVERKGLRIWPWIAAGAAVVIAVVLWGIADTSEVSEDLSSKTETTEPVPTAGTAPPAPPAVDEYLTFVKAPQAQSGLEHDYAADGIRKLTGALAALTRNDAGLRAEFESFRQKADALQENPKSLNHADQARDAFTATASLMSRVQQERAADAPALRDQIRQVREAAESVRGDQRLLDQRSQIDRFFQEAADAVSMLNRELGGRAQG